VLTGLRGRLEAADRRNLIRVMPAKGAGMSTSGSASGHADVLVIGGGVIGLSIAWRAAQRGMRVTVADPAPGGGASRAAAGMITPISEAAYAEKELFRLGRQSQGSYPAFTAELTALTGQPTGYRQAGTLQVAHDADDLAVLGEYQALQESFGVPARRLTARECRQAEPMLGPAICGGLLAADDASVDPRLLTSALLTAARQAGAELIRRPAAEILLGGGRAAGALLAGGTQVLATWVILAAGWNSGSIPGLPAGIAPPVRPVKGQILRLRAGPGERPAGATSAGQDVASASTAGPGAANAGWISAGQDVASAGTAGPGTADAGWTSPGPAGQATAKAGAAGPGGTDWPPGLLARTVRGIVRGSSVYLLPRESGELVIGATQEELGADTRVTAGGVWELLRDARTIVPGITELEFAEAVAGLRPGTPDNAPVLGPSALPGLVLATGHFRAGVLLAPVTADIITEYLATRRMPEIAAAFAPQRFARPGRARSPGPRDSKLRPASRRSTAGEGTSP
jgi:glycine oxidase